MPRRTLERAAVAAVVLSLAFVAVVSADTVVGDADPGTAGNQASLDLGNVAPDAVIPVPVAFTMSCSNSDHVGSGESVLVEFLSGTVPLGGMATMDDVTVGPAPETWPADGDPCSGSEEPLTGTGTVMITAPSTPGSHTYSLMFDRTASDGSTLSGMPALDFMLTVVANTPPVLELPIDFTIEGDTTGGWTADWTVSATDAEDDPDPTPVCVPDVGGVLPLGMTTVECTVTDSDALETMGSFVVTVVDTTPPVLVDVPGDQTVVSDDPAGAVATWTDPTATDIVDPDPIVECVPASGDTFPQGTTTVTCTATDDSGNTASASFDVTVGPEPAPPAGTPTAVFGPPIKADGLDGRAGRTIPMKVRLMLDGVSVGDGSLVLVVTPCDGGDPVAELEMDWRPGPQRWHGHLRTRGWEPGCYDVRAMHDGVDVGGTELRLFGKGGHSADSAAKAEKEAKAKPAKAAKAAKVERGPKPKDK